MAELGVFRTGRDPYPAASHIRNQLARSGRPTGGGTGGARQGMLKSTLVPPVRLHRGARLPQNPVPNGNRVRSNSRQSRTHGFAQSCSPEPRIPRATLPAAAGSSTTAGFIAHSTPVVRECFMRPFAGSAGADYPFEAKSQQAPDATLLQCRNLIGIATASLDYL